MYNLQSILNGLTQFNDYRYVAERYIAGFQQLTIAVYYMEKTASDPMNALVETAVNMLSQKSVESDCVSKLMFVMTLLFLSGCVPPVSSSQSQGDCVQATVPVAFPAYATYAPDLSQPVRTPVPLPRDWEPQLSAEQLQRWPKLDPATSIVARSPDEIWLIASHVGYWGSIIRFRPSTQEMITYAISAADGGEFVPGDLFLSKTGVLWGIGANARFIPGRAQWLLDRYDPGTDSFVPVDDTTGILTGTSFPFSIGNDTQGMLWFITGNELIRYDPRAQTAERMLDEKRGYRFNFLAVAPDDSIWLSASPVSSAEGMGPYLVIRYDPRSGELKDYGSPPEANGYVPLYFDRSGRLWAMVYGWLEFPNGREPEWYQIVRSPVFISDHVGELQCRWTRPPIGYESSNGLFWFRSGAGLVRLDLKQGQWCLVSRMDGPFTEDSAHNLWMAVQGQIYKYHTQP